MSVKALQKQLIAAVAMVIVAAVAVSSSTFAWFAINNTVTANGLTVSTQTSNNLFIAPLAAGATAIPADNTFGTLDTTTVAAAILEPVSSINAQSATYYYNLTDNTDATGEREDNTINYVSYATGISTDTDDTDSFDNDFEANYEASGAVGYTDYEFALKAVNSQNAAYHINLNKIALKYAGGQDASKAYRIAVFYQEADAPGDTVAADLADGTNGTLVDIKSVNGAAYFTSTNAVSAVNATAAVASLNTANAGITVAANSTKYYKVLVRMWLEGEDDTCNNSTFMNLSESWTLDLKLELESSAAGEQYITKWCTATVSATTYYYDGTTVCTDIDDVAGTTVASPSNDVKTAFGIPTTP